SALKYFFHQEYFNYGDKPAFDITTDVLIDYFEFLKNQDTLSLTTKKSKWILLISFLRFCMEYYRKYNFIVVIPKYSINWKGNHSEPKTNKDVVLSIDEVKSILNYLKIRNFKYYLIFRLFAETGMRKGELINIDYDNVNIKKRFIKTTGKTDKKIYYFSNELGKYLEIFLQERKSNTSTDKALFLSVQNKRFSLRQFNFYLKQLLKKLNISKDITCHTFRRSLNTFRKIMGCPNEDRKILLNHKVRDVNVDSYVKLNYHEFISLFDKWNPYKEIQI
ncbi:MAG: tyrosine-type recombinase/integrase, partial [Candidatus Thorarchaeota archaeon]